MLLILLWKIPEQKKMRSMPSMEKLVLQEKLRLEQQNQQKKYQYYKQLEQEQEQYMLHYGYTVDENGFVIPVGQRAQELDQGGPGAGGLGGFGSGGSQSYLFGHQRGNS